MATKLGIWNKALRLLGLPRLSALTDNMPTQYELEAAWEGVVDEVAEAGLWNFAIRTVELAPDDAYVVPGYAHAYTHPTDWVRTIAVSHHQLFDVEPDWKEQGGIISTNVTPLYLRYLASTRFGDSYIETDWPASFCDAVSWKLAFEIGPLLGASAEKTVMYEKAYRDALRRAKNLDAMNQPGIKFKPGSWVRAMRGSLGRGDNAYTVSMPIAEIGDV